MAQILKLTLLSLLLASALTAEAQSRDDLPRYKGCREASAGVALGEKHFIVGNDEDNVLRVYTLKKAKPVATLDLDKELVTEPDDNPKKRKADIEAATKIGKVSLWLGSHSRNDEGKRRKNRFQLFAVEFSLKTIGKARFLGSYHGLLKDLLAADKSWKLGLNKAYGRLKDKKHKIGPKDPGGFNMEGLSAIKGKKAVFLGFRNPTYVNKAEKPCAICIPLANPLPLATGKAKKAKFGKPILLDLDGFGIRSMEYSKHHKAYLIVAGPTGKKIKNEYRVYKWSGKSQDKPALIHKRGQDERGFTPEALVVYEYTDALQLFSDEGKKAKAGDKAADANSFQSRWLQIPLDK